MNVSAVVVVACLLVLAYITNCAPVDKEDNGSDHRKFKKNIDKSYDDKKTEDVEPVVKDKPYEKDEDEEDKSDVIKPRKILPDKVDEADEEEQKKKVSKGITPEEGESGDDRKEGEPDENTPEGVDELNKDEPEEDKPDKNTPYELNKSEENELEGENGPEKEDETDDKKQEEESKENTSDKVDESSEKERGDDEPDDVHKSDNEDSEINNPDVNTTEEAHVSDVDRPEKDQPYELKESDKDRPEKDKPYELKESDENEPEADEPEEENEAADKKTEEESNENTSDKLEESDVGKKANSNTENLSPATLNSRSKYVDSSSSCSDANCLPVKSQGPITKLTSQKVDCDGASCDLTNEQDHMKLPRSDTQGRYMSHYRDQSETCGESTCGSSRKNMNEPELDTLIGVLNQVNEQSSAPHSEKENNINCDSYSCQIPDTKSSSQKNMTIPRNSYTTMSQEKACSSSNCGPSQVEAPCAEPTCGSNKEQGESTNQQMCDSRQGCDNSPLINQPQSNWQYPTVHPSSESQDSNKPTSGLGYDSGTSYPYEPQDYTQFNYATNLQSGNQKQQPTNKPHVPENQHDTVQLCNSRQGCSGPSNPNKPQSNWKYSYTTHWSSDNQRPHQHTKVIRPQIPQMCENPQDCGGDNHPNQPQSNWHYSYSQFSPVNSNPNLHITHEMPHQNENISQQEPNKQTEPGQTYPQKINTSPEYLEQMQLTQFNQCYGPNCNGGQIFSKPTQQAPDRPLYPSNQNALQIYHNNQRCSALLSGAHSNLGQVGNLIDESYERYLEHPASGRNVFEMEHNQRVKNADLVRSMNRANSIYDEAYGMCKYSINNIQGTNEYQDAINTEILNFLAKLRGMFNNIQTEFNKCVYRVHIPHGLNEQLQREMNFEQYKNIAEYKNACMELVNESQELIKKAQAQIPTIKDS